MLPVARVAACSRPYPRTAACGSALQARRRRSASQPGAQSPGNEDLSVFSTFKGIDMKKVLLPALLASLLIACSGTGDQAADGTAGSAGASGSDTTTAAVSDSSISRNDMGALAGGDASGSSATDGSASGSIASLTDPNHILSQRTIYFDFDSFVIRPEFADLIDAHAALDRKS